MASKFQSVRANQIKMTNATTQTQTTTRTNSSAKPSKLSTITKLEASTMARKPTKAKPAMAKAGKASASATATSAATRMPTKADATQNAAESKLNRIVAKSPTTTTTAKSASTLMRQTQLDNRKVKTATISTPKKNYSRFSTTASCNYCYGGSSIPQNDGIPRRSSVFAYDLSRDERSSFLGRQFKSPMKSVPEKEIELLRNGRRQSYLEQRYERTPDDKYNYPEATSWRYGWFHKTWQQHNRRNRQPPIAARICGGEENRICRGDIIAAQGPDLAQRNNWPDNAVKKVCDGINCQLPTNTSSSKGRIKVAGFQQHKLQRMG